jgi:lipoprotein-anchoring transpeptidase ErfK/SrfK
MYAHVSPCRSRSRRTAAVAAGLAALVLVLGACTSSTGTPGASDGSSAPVAIPTITPAAAVLPFDAPAKFTVHQGKLESATVIGAAHGTLLTGTVGADGGSWVSDELPTPAAVYNVSAAVRDSGGTMHTLTLTLKIASIPQSQKLLYSVTPLAGWTVGVNAPVVIRFLKPVGDRSAVESALMVTSSVPVIGSWHWINSSEVHFRPENPWPIHIRVNVALDLEGVKAGPSLWGTSNQNIPFSIGDAHVSTVDGDAETFTVTDNGKRWAQWPTSLGRPQFATRSGNYIVLAKQPTRQMTSCSASITCDRNNPNFYDLTVNWDVRLSWSGTFVHSAPWSVAHQGVDNVSHGCINLSPAHATEYFNFARYGDIVTVKNTSRSASDLVAGGDPGMSDWNLSWSQYVGASALGSDITTGPLAG